MTAAQPSLVRLSGLGVVLQAKELRVPFPVKAGAWVAGWVHCWGYMGGSQSMFLSLPSPFL